MVGPIPVGVNRFILSSNPPDHMRIQNKDLIGVTVLLITCSYKDAKFVQIGYYINNEYAEPFDENSYPNPVDINKLYRNILADQPRVTRYAIDWTGANEPPAICEGDEDAVAAASADAEANDDDVSRLYILFVCDVYTYRLSQQALGHLDEMEEEDDDEDDDDEGDDNEEVDLEADEEADELEDGEDDDEDMMEEGEEGEAEEGDEVIGQEGGEYVYEEYYDENNTMDIERMIQAGNTN